VPDDRRAGVTDVLRYAAFTDTPSGGNPAGVVLDADGLDADAMLAIAAEVGYSETAFLTPSGDREFDVRYFSPVAEVPFCGHATVAAGVALADRDGPGPALFHTPAGDVPVDVRVDHGLARTTLTSVAPRVEEVAPDHLAAALRALRWSAAELDPVLPPRIGFAGARHLILAAGTRDRLARLDYDFDALRDLLLELDVTTVDLVWRQDRHTFHARNPFPVGGVVEDPATGAAAAAFGGYLRELGEVTPPAAVTILQGFDMGRPSSLLVELDTDRPEVRVSGQAVPL
jgi:PhzF family phenazine biosynthesis protein